MDEISKAIDDALFSLRRTPNMAYMSGDTLANLIKGAVLAAIAAYNAPPASITQGPSLFDAAGQEAIDETRKLLETEDA